MTVPPSTTTTVYPYPLPTVTTATCSAGVLTITVAPAPGVPADQGAPNGELVIEWSDLPGDAASYPLTAGGVPHHPVSTATAPVQQGATSAFITFDTNYGWDGSNLSAPVC